MTSRTGVSAEGRAAAAQSAPAPEETVAAVLTGHVYTGETGYALAGVRVAAGTPKDSPDGSGGAERELGSGVSGSDGSFTIEIRTGAADAGLTDLRRLAVSGGRINLVLRCFDTDGTLLSQSAPFPFTPGAEINTAVPNETKAPSPNDYKELSDRMHQYQAARMADIAQELTSLSPSRMFESWTVAQRLRMLSALERGFLDPRNSLAQAGLEGSFTALLDGARVQEAERMVRNNEEVLNALKTSVARARAFGSLLEVDSFLEPEKIGIGKIIDGINDGLREPIENPFWDQFPWMRSPLVGYRDYLLDLWIKSFAGLQQEPDRYALLDRLGNRFHQKFTTRDTTDQPANRILCGIMKKILTAKKGPYFGFDIPAAGVPDQKDLSDRGYLDQLIGMTGLTAAEAENRYRINLRRADSELSSLVQQNVETLQRLFTDSYQSVVDPSPVKPDLYGMAQPIISIRTEGVGPFFLEYEEWLERDRPFYGENHFDIRSTFYWSTDGRKETGDQINANSMPLADFVKENFNMAKYDPENATYYDGERMKWQWLRNYLDLQGLIEAAHADFRALNYAAAEQKYLQAREYCQKLRRFVRWINAYDPRATAKWQKKYAIRNMNELLNFERAYHVFFGWHSGVIPQYGDYTGNKVSDKWMDTYQSYIAYLVDHLEFRLLPACIAETRLPTGRFHDAAVELMGPAGFTVFTGSLTYYGGFPGGADGGPLPYGTNSDQTVFMDDSYIPGMTKPSNPVERAFFRIRLGEVLLEWADTLYRTNAPESIMRARELYKGVLFMHGEDPEISPEWGVLQVPNFFLNDKLWFRSRRNPAVTAQANRAWIGFKQIQDSVNYYGYKSNYVPPVRYRVLKEAADRFTASAKGAQSDFLGYMDKLDKIVVDEMTARTMVNKANSEIAIAQERAKIAQFQVNEVQKQVDAINAQIQAKQKEIADSESFLSQATSFFEGMGDAVKGMAGAAGGMMDESADDPSKSISMGDVAKLAASKSLATDSAALGAGVGMFAAFGMFAYAGYTSMQGLADAGDKRRAELKHLKEAALPAARALVELKQRDVTIARLQEDIARADWQLGKDLLAYYSTRFLNKSFWVQMSMFANRLMRRYVDLAGRTAWFAERALAFEQDRELSIIGFDYFPRSLQGVTGADQLGLHLAELEAARIQGLSETIPVKRTISMARHYPAAFAQLKNSGRCAFMTAEEPLRLDYPGVYGYRIRCVTVSLSYTVPASPHRGMLTNQGISKISRREMNSLHPLARFEDALPLSEFRMREDMWVHELPDATLLPFEGSGFETMWELSLSRNSGSAGLDKLTDLLLTFDLRANYSAALERLERAAEPASVKKLAVFSGKTLNGGTLVKFRKTGPQLILDFDLEKIIPAMGEKNPGKIVNLAVIAAGVKEKLKLTLAAKASAKTVNLELVNGVALSNAGDLATGNGGTPLPLNVLAGEDAAQDFKITVKRLGNKDVDFASLADILLAVEYETGN